MVNQVIVPIDDTGVVTLNADDFTNNGNETSRCTRAHSSGSPAQKRPPAKPPKKKPLIDLEQFDEILQMAEYEVNIDPYRGIFAKDGDAQSPWKSCLGTDYSAEEDQREATQTVRDACGCSCPSLVSWTNKNIQATKGRRRSAPEVPKIGLRPDSPNSLCQCDSNPFCIISLGGVVNDIVYELAEKSRVEEEVIVVDGDDEEDTMKRYDPDEKDNIYQDLTRNMLKAVRRQVKVKTKNIETHLKQTLQSLVSGYPVSDAIGAIRLRQNQLIFSNPLIEQPIQSTDTLLVTVPPGIENLGATCYLNTQLQCLAQNLVFLDGILSWVPPEDDNTNQMTNVLKDFQTLLANLSSGHQAVLNTLEFSNGLGLDHFEQQDPNEFSRLFLDKIHQTFATCDQPDLVSLLPHLFQGKTTYTTICNVCKTSSCRTEDFMDVTLPIVRPQKPKGQQTLKSCKKEHDTDLQYCVDRYTYTEKLHDDNQYYCETCGTKVDADRRVSFSTLPPVLNVQLCRYVFDRVRGVKTKLQDKVLLPIVLHAAEENGPQKTQKKFQLCAVMIHRGKSAYSGHYVAEAKSWETGQWFEFNDTEVKQIDQASCSCEPKQGHVLSGTGSSDAYNMFYVEEAFLAQSTLQSLRTCGVTPTSPAVQKIVLDRKDRFQELTQLCLEDGQAAKRLDDRKEFLRTSLITGFPEFRLDRSNLTDFIWVDGRFMRRYFTCKDRFELELLSSGSVIQHEHLLCPHRQGLHPRIARRGKLLPRQFYESLVAHLEAEKNAVRFDVNEQGSSVDRVLDAKNISCEKCSSLYRSEITEKLNLCKKLRFLYTTLDPKVDTSGEFATSPEGLNKYVISRSFITCLRGRISKLIKRFGDIQSMVPDKLNSGDQTSAYLCEGFDAVGVKGIVFPHIGDGARVDDSLDTSVNNMVTCEHGVLKYPSTSKSRCRVVSQSVWATIKELFPCAVEICLNDSGEDPVCQTCLAADQESQTLRVQVQAVAKFFKKLHSNTVKVEVDEIIKPNSDGLKLSHRIVHVEDLRAWKKFVDTFSKKDCGNAPDIRERIFRTLKHNAEIRFVDFECDEKDEKLAHKRCCLEMFRPTVCPNHWLPLSGAIFDHSTEMPLTLSADTAFISEKSYVELCTGISLVSSLLLNQKTIDLAAESTISSLLEEPTKLNLPFEWHARFGSENTEDNKEYFHCHSDDFKARFAVQTTLCRDETCMTRFHKWRNATNSHSKGTVQVGAGVADDPICVEEMSENIRDPKIDLLVFHIDPKSSQTLVSESISQRLQLPRTSTMDGFLRRSSRKRKPTYPNGAILAEDLINIDPSDNIASIRLRLFQECENESFHLGHELLVVSLPKNDEKGKSCPNDASVKNLTDKPKQSQLPEIFSFDFAWNERSLDQVCSGLMGDSSERWIREHAVCLLRKSVPRSDMEHEALLDHLISISSTSQAKETKEGNGKRKRSAERGFRGTLLTSGVTEISEVSQCATSAHPDKKCKSLVTKSHTNSTSPGYESSDEVQCLGSPPSENSPQNISCSATETLQDDMVHSSFDTGTLCNGNGGDMTSQKGAISSSEDDGSRLLDAVYTSLCRNPNVDQGDKACLEAANWVIQQNPTTMIVSELTDNAFAKYIDLTT